MQDEDFMHRAIELAEKGRFSVRPNPLVGCVLVRDGKIIAEGKPEEICKVPGSYTGQYLQPLIK